MRVLRPLRIISRNKLLKIAIQALYKALPSIFNVIVVSLFFFIIFGIIGINYFKGAFYECHIGDQYPVNILRGYKKTVVTKYDCLNVGGTWKNSDQNFDNMIEAISTLLQMASTEGWSEVML